MKLHQIHQLLRHRHSHQMKKQKPKIHIHLSLLDNIHRADHRLPVTNCPLPAMFIKLLIFHKFIPDFIPDFTPSLFNNFQSKTKIRFMITSSKSNLITSSHGIQLIQTTILNTLSTLSIAFKFLLFSSVKITYLVKIKKSKNNQLSNFKCKIRVWFFSNGFWRLLSIKVAFHFLFTWVVFKNA